MTKTAELKSIADDMEDDALTIRDLAVAVRELAGAMKTDETDAICRLGSIIQDRAIEIERKRAAIWNGLREDEPAPHQPTPEEAAQRNVNREAQRAALRQKWKRG